MTDTQKGQPDGINAKNSSDRPTGWARVEDLYKDLDQNMVDGFNKNIDTLLVFAGLLSAVLAAFLIQSNTLLQADNSQRTVDLLAQLVAIQMGSSFNQSAVEPTPFTLSSRPVVINTLWYLSLVLSLASALFGMMAKQWLREYMEWATMSTLPADAVFLRQLRYEAFVHWQTPAILASIPVLLEVAVVLFFTGVVVYLFTLNATVAYICTPAVVIMLTLAALSLILPAFFPRCPYKSPVGWALVLLMHGCASLWDMVMLRVLLISEARSNSNTGYFQPSPRWNMLARQPVKDWRTREFELQRRDGIVREILQANTVGSNVRQVSKEATRICALSRALLWIRETSQDGQLLATVDECYKMRNSPTIQADPPVNMLGYLILDYDVICEWLHVPVNAMRAYLHAKYRDHFGMNPLADFQATQDSSLRHDVLAKIFGTPWLVTAALGNTLSATVLQSLGHLSSGASTDPLRTTPLIVNHLLLCGHIISLDSNPSAQAEVARQASMKNFKCIFDLLSKNKELCQKLPGVRGILLYFLFKWEFTVFTPMSGQSSGYDDYATAACQILAGNQCECTRDDCDVFIRVSSLALEKARPEDAPHLPELLICMKKCTELSIERNWSNCGSYSTSNPWTAGPDALLYHLFHPQGLRHTRDMNPVYPLALIDALSRSSEGPLQRRSTELQALIARSAEITKAISTVNQTQLIGNEKIL